MPGLLMNKLKRLIDESVGENIFKIGEYLTKLQARSGCPVHFVRLATTLLQKVHETTRLSTKSFLIWLLFGKDQTCISGDMLADRQTHTQTDTQTQSSQYSAPL